MLSANWALKRLYKFALKRALGKVLQNELDLEQLDVQMGTGTVELRNLLLDTDYLTEQLAGLPVAVTSGYIGCVRAIIPWTGLVTSPAAVEIHDLDITVAPRPDSIPSRAASPQPNDNGEDGGAEDAEDWQDGADIGGLGFGSIDGVNIIARLVERFVINLRAVIINLRVRLEMPTADITGSGSSAGAALILRLARLDYSNDAASSEGSKDTTLQESVALTKTVSIQGLTVAICEFEASVEDDMACDDKDAASDVNGSMQLANDTIISGADAGGQGSVHVTVSWQGGLQRSPQVNAVVDMEALHVRLTPRQLQLLTCLPAAFVVQPLQSAAQSFLAASTATIEQVVSQSMMKASADETGLDANSEEGAADTAIAVDRQELASSAYVSLLEDLLVREEYSTQGKGAARSSFLPSWLVGDGSRANMRRVDSQSSMDTSIDEFYECVEDEPADANMSVWAWAKSTFGGVRPTVGAASALPVEAAIMEWTVTMHLAGLSATALYLNTANDSQDEWCGECLNFSVMDISSQLKGVDGKVSCTASAQSLTAYEQLRQTAVDEFTLRAACEQVFAVLPLMGMADMPHNKAGFHSKHKLYCRQLLHVVRQSDPMSRTAALELSSVQCGQASERKTIVTVELEPICVWWDASAVLRIAQFLPETGPEQAKREQDYTPQSALGDDEDISDNGSQLVTSNLELTVCVQQVRVILMLQEGNGLHPLGEQLLAVDIFRGVVAPYMPLPPLLCVKTSAGCSGQQDCNMSFDAGQVMVNMISALQSAAGREAAPRQNAPMRWFTAHRIASVRTRRDAMATDLDHSALKIEVNLQRGHEAARNLLRKAHDAVSLSMTGSRHSHLSSLRPATAAQDQSTACSDDDIGSLELRETAVASSDVAKVQVDITSVQCSRLASCKTAATQSLPTHRPAAAKPSKQCSFQVLVSTVTCKLHVDPASADASRYSAFTFALDEYQAFHISSLDQVASASYTWSQFDSCSLTVTSSAKDEVSSRVLLCSSSSLGRGDGVPTRSTPATSLSHGTAGVSIVLLALPPKFSTHPGPKYMVVGTMRGASAMTLDGSFAWLKELRDSVNVKDVGISSAPAATPPMVEALLELRDIAVMYQPVQPQSTALPSSAAPTGSAVLAVSSIRISSGDAAASSGLAAHKLGVRRFGLLVTPFNTHHDITAVLTAAGLRRAGFVRVAQEPALEASLQLKLNREPDTIQPSIVWALSCSNCELHFATCSDSAAALLQIASCLQQSLLPPPVTSGDNGLGVVGCRSGAKVVLDSVLEDAFAYSKLSGHRTSSSSSSDWPGITSAPIFIEDHFPKSVSDGSSYGLGSSSGYSSQQNTPRPSSSMQSTPESTSCREAAGWYGGDAPQVMDNHVPRSNPAEPVKHTRNTQRKRPPALGTVILRDLNVRWLMCAGLDWPDGMNGVSRPTRDEATSIEVVVDGLRVSQMQYAPGHHYVSQLHVAIRELAVYDHRKDASWRRIMGYHSAHGPRETNSSMVRVELTAVRPEPSAPLEEHRLRVALLPIRLHLDQHHVHFWTAFFAPLATISIATAQTDPLPQDAMPFFQMCEVLSTVVRIDYKPRHVDLIALRDGNFAEILNLVPWEGVELQLKKAKASGLQGWSALGASLGEQWLQDIAANQAHKFVTGIAPIRSLCAVGSGAVQLVRLPTEQYKKDRQLARGLQRGVTAFVRSISLEALGVGAQVAAGAHDLLSMAEIALGGANSPTHPPQFTRSSSQPLNAREGLMQARETLVRGFESAAATVVGTPMKAFQRGSSTRNAVASVFKAAPAAAVAPASAAALALHRTLLGVRNSLDPRYKVDHDLDHTPPPCSHARGAGCWVVWEVLSTVVRIDDKPRHVDLFALRDLKKAKASGLQGWSALGASLGEQWLQNTAANQADKFVTGFAPIRSLCAVGSGAVQLVRLPMEHYKNDRQLARGLQRVVIAFVRSISQESLGVGAQACETLVRGFESAAATVVGTPMKAFQCGSSSGPASYAVGCATAFTHVTKWIMIWTILHPHARMPEAQVEARG
eukprot:jgi/Chlat1/6412/Chrsp45S06026